MFTLLITQVNGLGRFCCAFELIIVVVAELPRKLVKKCLDVTTPKHVPFFSSNTSNFYV